MATSERNGFAWWASAQGYELGTGRLTWNREERVTDRYGFVYLVPDGDSLTPPTQPSVTLNLPMTILGQRGRLIARVLETRTSTHIGDLFHGVFPTTPVVGEDIVLGEGKLVIETSPYVRGPMVGILPDDERATLRMDIAALYRAHEQTVTLWFEPKEAS